MKTILILSSLILLMIAMPSAFANESDTFKIDIKPKINNDESQFIIIECIKNNLEDSPYFIQTIDSELEITIKSDTNFDFNLKNKSGIIDYQLNIQDILYKVPDVINHGEHIVRCYYLDQIKNTHGMLIKKELTLVAQKQFNTNDYINMNDNTKPENQQDTNQQYTTQPNALVSHNSNTNEVQVSWNFTLDNSPTTCFLKGDVRYHEDNNVGKIEDYIPSFTPSLYSVTSNPEIYQAVNDKKLVGEKISCTGDMRIDIDTIMNHSENTNNYQDLEIFLTFYYPDSNGDFNVNDIYRIDEVLIMYTPISTFTNATQEWACKNQIGNVLHIDDTGVHGNNGDNCNDDDFKYLSLDNNQYVDIGMKNSGSHGVISYGIHNESSFTQLIQTTNTETKKKSGGSSYNPPPTIGKDNTGRQIISDGLVLNGFSLDVDNFKTHMIEQFTEIGKQNTLQLKLYEDKGLYNIAMVQLGLGVKEIGTPLSESDVIFEIGIDNFANDINNPRTGDFNLIDPNGIIDTAKIHLDITPCGIINQDCLLVEIKWTYADSPSYPVLMTTYHDRQRSSNTDYFNDGLTVIDNEIPITSEPVKKMNECTDQIKQSNKRTHCNYNNLKQYEIERAEQTIREIYNINR